MIDYFDTSVLVAAMVREEPNHDACLNAWLSASRRVLLVHGVVETFACLTGGKRPHLRLDADLAARVLRGNLKEFQAQLVEFSGAETLELLSQARRSGARGGSVYDFLHICAARKSRADRIFTLNMRHFNAIAPDLAARIHHPADLHG